MKKRNIIKLIGNYLKEFATVIRKGHKNKSVNKYGLTEERYAQIMKSYNNDEKTVEELVDFYGAELCNKAYATFKHRTGMIEILAIDSIDAYENDEEATKQAIKDGVKIIPVEELPENFDMRYLGWIDTPENREAIRKHCELLQ